MRIYLDHAATTPLLPGVAEAMAPWLGDRFGNPSSLYAEGRQARAAIDSARETLSDALGCGFGEVIFTSSGTEAANMAIVGAALACEDPGRNRILFGAAEHHCVLNTYSTLDRLGFQVETVPVGRDARPDLDQLAATMDEDVLLVALMAANNELGTIAPVGEIAELGEAGGALYFCDAVQLPPIFQEQSTGPRVPLVSIASHKLNGPKGAGALLVRAGTKLKPLILGGGQERELRAGTEDVAAIVGFAEAVRIHRRKRFEFEAAKSAAKRAFVDQIEALRIPGLSFTVQPLDDSVLSGHVHLRIANIPADTILILLDRMGVSASSGSACSSGSTEPSHVLLACGFGIQAAREVLRFTFGPSNSAEEAVRAADILAKAVAAAARG